MSRKKPIYFLFFRGEFFQDGEQILRYHVFDPAGIFFGCFLRRPDFHKYSCKNLVALVNIFSLFFTFFREAYLASCRF